MDDLFKHLYRAVIASDLYGAEHFARLALRKNRLAEMLRDLFSGYPDLSSSFYEQMLSLPSLMCDAEGLALSLYEWHQVSQRDVCEWLVSPGAEPAYSMRGAMIAAVAQHELRANIHDLFGEEAPCVFIRPGVLQRELSRSDEIYNPEKSGTVLIEHPLVVQKTPVTNAQYLSLMGQDLSFINIILEENDHPVSEVNWMDALEYCDSLSVIMELPNAYNLYNEDGTPGDHYFSETLTPERRDPSGYRLPTEAEWEYFCRAGTTEATYNGEFSAKDEHSERSIEPTLDPIAWYKGNSNGQTHPVATKAPNPWGLWDTLGNVNEWCWDKSDSWFDRFNDDIRIIRGGNCNSYPHSVKANDRETRNYLRRWGGDGFRYVRSILDRPWVAPPPVIPEPDPIPPPVEPVKRPKIPGKRKKEKSQQKEEKMRRLKIKKSKKKLKKKRGRKPGRKPR